jgi:hypothetical protein
MQGNRKEQKPALRVDFGCETGFTSLLTSRMTSMNVTSNKGQRVTYGAWLPCGLPRDSLTFGID